MQVVLASGSPRRLELLRQIGIKPLVMVSNYHETESGLAPEVLVSTNALGKARSVLAQCSDEVVVIAADTVVVLDGEILGKPKNKEEAGEMLRALSGKAHWVLTGTGVFYRGKHAVRVSATKVYFRNLNEKEIQSYVATGEPLDKAGAYGIQGQGAVFITKIEGSYSNVVGLDLADLYTLFAELDVEQYDKFFFQGTAS
ncbi:MAG: Maf family protein [Acidaminococcaceae bacterium]|jgi:septum formation protein|nr:Maf family protein [Acidaminococcaceae bacterium]MCI2109961.1 Maf family protein [Acidaminococcaceae bacterium]